jgi:flagellar biosynthesis protein FliQ
VEPGLVAAGREALLVALAASAPALGAALLAGLAAGVVQAATQVQDHAIGAVPRLAAVLAALALAGPWAAGGVARFARACLEAAVGMTR